MKFIIETDNRTLSKRILSKGYKPQGMEKLSIEEILNRDDRIVLRFSNFKEFKLFVESGIFKASQN